jgi:hypothetical protein
MVTADKIRIIKKFLSGSNVDELLKVMAPTVDALTPVWFEIRCNGSSSTFFINGEQYSAQEYEQTLSRETAIGSFIWIEERIYSDNSVH